MRQPGRGVEGEEPLARSARVPVTTSASYPALDRFVRYCLAEWAQAGPSAVYRFLYVVSRPMGSGAEKTTG